jgi:3',5'-cyclic AMP phosphodiesterase CpdA
VDPLVFGYEQIYDMYMANVSIAGANIKPYMVLPGNHEAECHSPICILNSTLLNSLANFSAYNARFLMPYEESGAVSDMWYSFEHAGVHFIQVDTETDFPNSPNDGYVHPTGGFGDQLAWLKADLDAAVAKRAAGEINWILVAGHRPIYSRDETDAAGVPTGSALAVQAAFEPLMQAAGVDMFFAGHVHR